MSRGKVGHRPVMDTTLLSTSAIGSPAAFSTAIKPPGNFSTQPSSADSSLVAQHPHNHTHLGSVCPAPFRLDLPLTTYHIHAHTLSHTYIPSGDPAGQLSLSLASEAPPTEGTVHVKCVCVYLSSIFSVQA